jgi:hypothetical protein
MARTLRDARLCTPGSAFVKLQNAPENETPKSALGDRKPKRRFRRQFSHTETSPYVRNAATWRHFERDPISYALETDWPVGAAGFEPLHIRIGTTKTLSLGGGIRTSA